MGGLFAKPKPEPVLVTPVKIPSVHEGEELILTHPMSPEFMSPKTIHEISQQETPYITSRGEILTPKKGVSKTLDFNEDQRKYLKYKAKYLAMKNNSN
jgi:hypothetical protein